MADETVLACAARLNRVLNEFKDPPEVLLSALATQLAHALRIMREEGVITREVAQETVALIERIALCDGMIDFPAIELVDDIGNAGPA